MPSICEEVKKRSKTLRKVKGVKHDMSDKSHRELPTFTMSDKDLPEIKDWEVGGKYKLLMVVEQTSLSKGGFFNEGDDGLEARFKVKKIAAVDESNLKRLSKKFS